MNELTFFSVILNEVSSTINELKHWEYFSTCNVEVLIDDECGYRAIFEFDNCLGEIVVDQPDFAPYRYVKIEVLSAVAETNECLFVWYDSDYDDADSIREHILQGLKVAVDYAKKQYT